MRSFHLRKLLGREDDKRPHAIQLIIDSNWTSQIQGPFYNSGILVGDSACKTIHSYNKPHELEMGPLDMGNCWDVTRGCGWKWKRCDWKRACGERASLQAPLTAGICLRDERKMESSPSASIRDAVRPQETVEEAFGGLLLAKGKFWHLRDAVPEQNE